MSRESFGLGLLFAIPTFWPLHCSFLDGYFVTFQQGEAISWKAGS